MNEHQWEISTSVALDGELDPAEALELLDVMADDARCRAHWQRMRAADRRLDPLIHPVTQRLRATRSRPHPGWWAVPAAAIALLAILMLRPPTTDLDRLPGPEGRPLTVRLSGDAGDMTDRRFVQLVVEVLRSDEKYQRKLLEVLEEVRPPASVADAGSGEGEPETRERLVLGREEGSDTGPGELPWEALAGIH